MNKNAAKLIRRQSLANCDRWQPPLVSGAPAQGESTELDVSPPTAEAIEKIHQQAREEGLDLGHREGFRKGYDEGRTELEGQSRQLQSLLDLLAEPLKQLDKDVEQSVVDLAVLIARHLVRRELKTNPGEIVAVVREAMARLPVNMRHPRIHLHPEDLVLVMNALNLGDEEKAWRLEPDPLTTRGGCLVETETSFIDATVEARLAAIVSKMLGGERQSDRERDTKPDSRS